VWVTNMNKSEDGHDARNMVNLSKARSTGHFKQVALDVANIPDDLGRLMDKGIEDHFRDR